MEQAVIPARSTSPQNDLTLMRLIKETVDTCTVTYDCRRCLEEARCKRWYDGISEISSYRPLTYQEYYHAMERFRKIQERVKR